jgi:hypothetical protein
VAIARYLSKMLFFESTTLVFGRGLAVVAFFFVAVVVGGSTVAGFVGVGTTADAGSAAGIGAEAATGAELGFAAIPAAPSPTTTNGAQ